MIRLLLVGPDKNSFSDMENFLGLHHVSVVWAENGNKAISMLDDQDFALVVTDENAGDMTGLELIEKLINKNPIINCAAISSLSSEEFHEASEGLGILMKLPVRPDQEDSKNLLDHLMKVLNLTSTIA